MARFRRVPPRLASTRSAESGAFGIWVPISFPIPIAEDTRESAVAHVEYGPSEEGGTPTEEEEDFFDACPGSYVSPAASPGYLCIFENQAFAKYNTTFEGARQGPTAVAGSRDVLNGGTYLTFAPNEAAELAFAAGSFAVTGCSATLPAADPNKCPAP